MLVRVYKKHRIEKHNGVVQVVSPNGNRFIVGLDDSKSSGKRRFINKANTITSAKRYIDYITR
jgi:ribosome biogenesis protein Nip4